MRPGHRGALIEQELRLLGRGSVGTRRRRHRAGVLLRGKGATIKLLAVRAELLVTQARHGLQHSGCWLGLLLVGIRVRGRIGLKGYAANRLHHVVGTVRLALIGGIVTTVTAIAVTPLLFMREVLGRVF